MGDQSPATDWQEPLANICSTHQQFQELFLQAASYQYRLMDHLDVMDNLRFIMVPQEVDDLEKDKLKSPPIDCICTEYCTEPAVPKFDYSQDKSTPTLILTEPGRLKGCSHYIAISYRWQQHITISDSCQISTGCPSKYMIRTYTDTRPCRAPANVIYRAISYAKAYNYRFIWIDQECIDQHDQVDKERHIQAMHLIYRSAQQVVAILNCCITTQAHMDIFRELGVGEGHNFKINDMFEGQPLYEKTKEVSFLKTAIELAEIIATDSWYTRAWTLQEAILAFLPLHLLIPYQSSLVAPDWAGKIPGQLVISEAVVELGFVRTFFWRIRAWPKDDLSDAMMDFQQRADTVNTVLRGTIPDYKTHNTQNLDLCRQPAVDAIWSVLNRKITEPSDLIAIIGNLCGYRIRLDTRRIHDTQLSFTVSVFTLAFLNGDMSLLLALERASPKDRNIWYLLSDCSLRDAIIAASQSIRTSQPYDCLIDPPTVTQQGLHMIGYMWDFGQDIGLEGIRDRFLEQWNKQGARIEEEIFWAILEHILDIGQLRLLQAIFRTSRFSLSHDLSEGLKVPLKGISSRGGIAAGEGWLVRTVMKQGRFYYGTTNQIGCICPQEEQAFILLRSSPVTRWLFTPRRVLTLAETEGIHGRKEPNGLLTWNVHIREHVGQEYLQCLGHSFTINYHFPTSEEFCVVGNSRHFFECPGQQYQVHAFQK
ncbi:heterokaryon incompatibility protein-domain-containing protein [Xylogone sp. PMI_703]|nr:heterokaryon incompatibility protein-domain-containing protein [Xylogone sp. PMI_703]